MANIEMVPYSYRIFEHQGKILIQVLFGTIGVYDEMMELSEEEIFGVRNEDGFGERLATEIQTNPDRFKHRFLRGSSVDS